MRIKLKNKSQKNYLIRKNFELGFIDELEKSFVEDWSLYEVDEYINYKMYFIDNDMSTDILTMIEYIQKDHEKQNEKDNK